MYKRAAGRFNLLRRIRPLIDKSSAEKIYKGMIQPVFTYCGTLGLCWLRSRKSGIESIKRRSQKVIRGSYQVQAMESLIKRQSCQLVFVELWVSVGYVLVKVELKALNVEVRKSLEEIIKSSQWRV